MDVGGTDVAPDCVAAGSILEPSALVSALAVSPLVHEREVSCQQRLKVIRLVVLLLRPDAGSSRGGAETERVADVGLAENKR